jgi:lipopolysaccharide transport system ATP-binding protein
MSTVISVAGLGKRYRIGAAAENGRKSIGHLLTSPIRNFGKLRRLSVFDRDDDTDIIWALRDISFDVRQGEVLGIIGANGAGKSTLLKILSRITKPTEGRIELTGRVGSLLEVGTGFHHELSGRDNIYLNGSILGMDRQYIRQRFDEIVDFSGVAQFIDTPVKRYSSGMYLRLAFAVAAHLEPDILIVDEVLAVGDAEFQKKCIGKMSDVAGEGRTVIFVSHTMDAVQRLCSRCLCLGKGRMIEDGRPAQVISRYLSRFAGGALRAEPNEWVDLSRRERNGSGEARVTAARFSSNNEQAADNPYPLGPLDFEVTIESDADRSIASLALMIASQANLKLVNADTVINGQIIKLQRGRNQFKISLPSLPLNPGVYAVGFWVAPTTEGHPVYDHMEVAFEVEVIADPAHSWGKTPGSNGVVATAFEVSPIADDPSIHPASLIGAGETRRK